MRYIYFILILIIFTECSANKDLITEIQVNFKQNYPEKVGEFKSSNYRNSFRKKVLASFFKYHKFENDLILIEVYAWGNSDIDELQQMFFIKDNQIQNEIYYRHYGENRIEIEKNPMSIEKKEVRYIQLKLETEDYKDLINMSNENSVSGGGDIFITILKKDESGKVEIIKTMIIDLFMLSDMDSVVN